MPHIISIYRKTARLSSRHQQR